MNITIVCKVDNFGDEGVVYCHAVGEKAFAKELAQKALAEEWQVEENEVEILEVLFVFEGSCKEVL